MTFRPDAAPLVLVDSFDVDAWQRLAAEAIAGAADRDTTVPQVEVAARFLDASDAELRAAFPEAAVIFAADARALATLGHPVRCLDPSGEGETFRACARDLWIVTEWLAQRGDSFDRLRAHLDPQGVLVAPMSLSVAA